MKGIVFHTRGFSVHDGPGIRRAIFLKGCPLRCAWCHNPESQSFAIESMETTQRLGDKIFRLEETVGYEVPVSEIIEDIRKDIPFFEESGGGVTLTGGEPLAQPDFAIELLKACKELDIHTALDTCGYATQKLLEQTLQFTNLYLYDLKLFDSAAHNKYTGVPNELILSNLELISSCGKSIIIRIPLVEGITDTPSNLDGLCSFISKLNGVQRIDLLPYHSLATKKFEQMGKANQLSHLPNYPKHRAQAIADEFVGLAPVVSVGG